MVEMKRILAPIGLCNLEEEEKYIQKQRSNEVGGTVELPWKLAHIGALVLWCGLFLNSSIS